MPYPSDNGDPIPRSARQPAPWAYTVHPLSEDRARGIAAAVVAVMAAVAAGVGTQSAWFTGLALLFLGRALAPFFLPTNYELTPNGIAWRQWGAWRSRPWSEFRSYTILGDSALLTAGSRPFPRLAHRTLTLPLGTPRQRVLAWLDYQMGTSAEKVPSHEWPVPSGQPTG